MNYDPKLAEELRELAEVKEKLDLHNEATLLRTLAAMADAPPKPGLKERIRGLGNVGAGVPAYSSILLGRNESFWHSLYLGWLLVPFWMPTSLGQIVLGPVLNILSNLLGLALGIGAWVMVQITLLMAAPFGMVRRGKFGVESADDDISAA